VNIKKLSLAVAGALLVVGCAGNQGIVKNADLKPDSDSIKPKPVSVVFKRPDGNMRIEYENGKFISLTVVGTAAQQANNAPSSNEAKNVAENKALASIGRFIKSEVTSTRNTKILSTAIQKSLIDTTNGVGEENNTVIDDTSFDASGNPKVTTRAYDDGSKDQAPLPVKEGGANTNTQKIAEINRENISVMSRAFLKGVECNNGITDPASSFLTVSCTISIKNIDASNDLARRTGNN
jgi:hypothetical protein